MNIEDIQICIANLGPALKRPLMHICHYCPQEKNYIILQSKSENNQPPKAKSGLEFHCLDTWYGQKDFSLVA